MGAPWRGHRAWKIVEQLEGALGEPVGPLLLDADADTLGRTRNAQLAVLCTSLLAWEAARTELDDVVAFGGHSLGQVTALIAAGALDMETGARFAARRAELTQAAADAHPGRMAALLGATVEQAEQVCRAAPGACWVANDNAPGQVVIAGTPAGLETALAHCKDAGVRRATALNVDGAFHTPLMNDARPGLVVALADIDLRTPTAPVVSNHDGVLYADGEGWGSRLVEHVTVPVRWRECMTTLAAAGATTFVEVGHGAMIAGVAKRTVPEVRVVACGTPHESEQLARRVGS
jgi:[acyl-carrier-protein] S-malonyltransferase